MANITQERLKELLQYDPQTGHFYWRVRTTNRIHVGDLAGTFRDPKRDGYRRIKVEGRLYYAHRLAWLYVHGEWPKGEIDHKGLDPERNHMQNLRPATRSQQVANSRKRAMSKNPFKGVDFHKGRKKPWHARLTKDYRCMCLGYYATAEEAHEAYFRAAQIHFGDFAHRG